MQCCGTTWEWTLIGAPAGAVLGPVGWRLAPSVLRNPIGWGLGSWGAFAVFQVLNVGMLGIGRTAVTTSSGIVTVGLSALDAVVGSAVVLVFCGLLILGARPAQVQEPMVRSAS